MNCQRCGKTYHIICYVCTYHLCKKCIKFHDQYQECFIEKQIKKCYLCDNDGYYDYGVKKFICPYHI
jgi:hypothetical protein